MANLEDWSVAGYDTNHGWVDAQSDGLDITREMMDDGFLDESERITVHLEYDNGTDQYVTLWGAEGFDDYDSIADAVHDAEDHYG